jgi:two-component system, NarL family, sensor histidine kinase UhpB
LSSGAIGASKAARPVRVRRSAQEHAIRQVLARELHDRVGQTLTTMLVELENFKVGQVGRESVLRQVDVFEDSTREVLNSLRAVLYELRGEVGVEDTLVMSLGSLITRFQEKTRIAANLTVLPGWPAVLKSSAALNVYRIIEEALTNVRLHSGAGAVRVELGVHSATELAVVVTDDGRGVDTHHSRPLGLGMVGMRERALILGGQVLFESNNGDGTTVRATFPRVGVTAEELTA